MPIGFHYDASRRILWVEATGTLDRPSILDYLDRVREQTVPDCAFREVVDLSGVESVDVEFSTLSTVVNRFGLLQAMGLHLGSHVLAPDPATLQFAETLAQMLRTRGIPVRVYRDREAMERAIEAHGLKG